MKTFEILGVNTDGALVCLEDSRIYGTYQVMTEDYCKKVKKEEKDGEGGAFEAWQAAVAAGNTMQGFKDWYESYIEPNIEGYFYGQDCGDNWKIAEAYEALPLAAREALVEALNKESFGGTFAGVEELDAEVITNVISWGTLRESTLNQLVYTVASPERIKELRAIIDGE